jgi:hypothetical protein
MNAKQRDAALRQLQYIVDRWMGEARRTKLLRWKDQWLASKNQGLALKALERIMVSWLAGSARGGVLSWQINCGMGKAELARKLGALKRLERVMALWLAGTIRCLLPYYRIRQ